MLTRIEQLLKLISAAPRLNDRSEDFVLNKRFYNNKCKESERRRHHEFISCKRLYALWRVKRLSQVFSVELRLHNDHDDEEYCVYFPTGLHFMFELFDLSRILTGCIVR